MRLVLGLCLSLAPGPALLAADKPATVAVAGYGLLGNRELRQMLDLVRTDKQPQYFDATFVEDAALVMLSRATRDGYLNATVTARMRLVDGTQLTQSWDSGFTEFLPRPLQVRRLILTVHKGVLFHYRQLQFTGLQQVREPVARGYFVDADFLLPLKTARVFTPARLEQSVANLTRAYERLGYTAVKVRVASVERDRASGRVAVVIDVQEGPRQWVRSVTVQLDGPDAGPARLRRLQPAQPYSTAWQADLIQQLRAEQYRRGYPDATASLRVQPAEPQGTNVDLDVLAEVHRGPHVTVGAVRFAGNDQTRTSVLARRVRLEPGGPLDRIAAERGRYRLARLGIFDAVDLSYLTATGQARDVIYTVDEGKRINLSLMAGWGSYEMLRGGLSLEQYNLFGRAHSARLQLVHSLKASSLDYLYTMPELIGEDINVFVDLAGLRREEVSFTREEYSASLGAQRRLSSIDTDASLRYQLQLVTATDVPESIEASRRARISALTLDLRHDKREDPLLPRRGYKLAGNLELASVGLGGEVDYQRLEVDSSVHLSLGRGQYLHLGLSHGVALTLGGDQAELPFNKRFFPGGEGSVRGYQQGEAAPLDAAGDALGAETFTQTNLEFEQLLTRHWSVVLFVDGVGFARELDGYPVEDALFSAGGGIRFKTIVGPVRLEYGHNLNPRRHDPTGTLHFSLGFPF